MNENNGNAIVAQSPDPAMAEIWLDALRSEGIEASTFERGVGGALGGASPAGWAVYPIIVPRMHLAAARSIIADLGGASHLLPVRDAEESRIAARSALILVLAVVAGVVIIGLVGRFAAG